MYVELGNSPPGVNRKSPRETVLLEGEVNPKCIVAKRHENTSSRGKYQKGTRPRLRPADVVEKKTGRTFQVAVGKNSKSGRGIGEGRRLQEPPNALTRSGLPPSEERVYYSIERQAKEPKTFAT